MNRRFKQLIHFLAYGFGLGLIPFAPGTFGTLAAIPIYLLLQHLPLIHYSLIVAVLFVLGIPICNITAKDLQYHDHPSIVWDEIVGYLLTMLAMPIDLIGGLIWLILGFILFRLFDITKPWPIRVADQHVKGGFGIMLDDMLAAVYAAIVLQLLVKWLA